MQIHVARRAAQLGVFTPEEIVAGLRSGRFLPSDLAWRDGMASWLPLGEWPEFRGIVAPPSLGAAALPEPTPLPWEESKSLASAVATVAILFRRPAEALPGARLSFGSTQSARLPPLLAMNWLCTPGFGISAPWPVVPTSMPRSPVTVPPPMATTWSRRAVKARCVA